MARKISASADPALSLDFFISGFYTYRSQLFAPYKGIGVNVVSFHDPVIDGMDFELTDKLEWTRRPGYSIFCPISLGDNEIVNQFYSSRTLNGTVNSFVDTSTRLATFSSTSLTTIVTKTTTAQGYVATVGNRTYYADSAAADLYAWDGKITAVWGLQSPTITPTVSGIGFWQPDTSFGLGNSLLDSNGCVESVTSILVPNGAFEGPATATTLPLAGSLPYVWSADTVSQGGFFGYCVVDGYRQIQHGSAYSTNSTTVLNWPFPNPVTLNNVLIVSIALQNDSFYPNVVSISDNLGSIYTLQAFAQGQTVGSTGFYPSTEWIYTAPVTNPGACTVRIQLTCPNYLASFHEMFGITATPSASGHNYVEHGGSTFSAGTVTASGTELIFSSLLLYAAGAVTSPTGYAPGENISSSAAGQQTLADAYRGETGTVSPSWGLPGPPNGQALGITLAFPITSLVVGYTPYLFFSDYNFAIPSNATIKGIAVRVPKVNAALDGSVQDNSVRLVIGGSVVGADQASSVPWSNTGYAATLYGSPTYLWGLTPTPAQINANGLTGFGMAISAAIASTTGGSVIPEVGFLFPNQPTITIYYTIPGGTGGPGISGDNEPIWSTSSNGVVNDGGLTWTNYDPIQTWLPTTAFPTPVVILDPNGYLQLSTFVANPIPAWDPAGHYSIGNIVYFGGQYWISIFNGDNNDIVPSVAYATTGSSTTVPYWALTTTPLVTGLIAPVWNTTIGGITEDGSYTWTNIGHGTGLAFYGYSYVYGFRTVYGHISTCSPFSANTGAILGPLNASITGFSITSNVVTFQGNNNFQIGDVFSARGLSVGTYLNEESFTVTASISSATFPLTSVEASGTTVTITAINNLVAGQRVAFSGVANAVFLNGLTLTVLSAGLSPTQFEASLVSTPYGPTADSGNVTIQGSYSANFTHFDVAFVADNGSAIPRISNVMGMGTNSPLCNATAAITSVSITANIVTLIADNNFQPGLWVTFSNLANATFLNDQQLQVISVDQPLGTQNTQFQVYFAHANYIATADSGLATFNAVEIYRTSDGGGQYLFDGAVTNPQFGAAGTWSFDDFTVDADLDELLLAPLNHQNDPPPSGAPPVGPAVGATGTILVYWQGRLWMVVGNYVYFDAGPDCTNGIPEEAWPPSNRFQYPGPVLALQPTADGAALLVYLADRVATIMGGPETISFYSTDFLSNFGISNPNAIFRDGSTLGQFTTQKQYFEVIEKNKEEIGQHIADYLSQNFDAAKSYVAMHRDGLDVGAFISNGTDRVVRYGSNIEAWSVPAFPFFGAGALASIETSVGTYSLMLATPHGGVTDALGFANPTSGTSIGTGIAWVDPSNITLGVPTDYATVTFPSEGGTSQILRAANYPLALIPSTASIQGITLTVVGTDTSGGLAILTVTPTNAVPGAESHTFTLGSSNTTLTFGSSTDVWGMPWNSLNPCPCLEAANIGFDIVATADVVPLAISWQGAINNGNPFDTSNPGIAYVIVPSDQVGMLIFNFGDDPLGITGVSTPPGTTTLQTVVRSGLDVLVLSATPAPIPGTYTTTWNGNGALVNGSMLGVSANSGSVPTVIQSAQAMTTGTTTATITLPGVRAGDTIVLYYTFAHVSPTSPALVSITDSMGNVYDRAFYGSGNGFFALEAAAVSQSVASGDLTITIAQTTNLIASNWNVVAIEVFASAGYILPNIWQSVQSTATGTQIATIDLPAVHVGDAIVLWYSYTPSSAPAPDVTVTDNLGNPYVYAFASGNAYYGLAAYYCLSSVAAGDVTITAAQTTNLQNVNWQLMALNAAGVAGVASTLSNPADNNFIVVAPKVIAFTSVDIPSFSFPPAVQLITFGYDPVGLTGTDDVYTTPLQSNGGTLMMAHTPQNFPGEYTTGWIGTVDGTGNTSAFAGLVALFGSGGPTVSISEVQITITYQNPGNYLYARDLNSWGDGGAYGKNDGTPYPTANIVLGSITLSQPGAPMFPLQHVVGYFDAVGCINKGIPNVWIMPNEISDKKGIGFVQLPEVVPEPPQGQNIPSASLLALRWPVNMLNSNVASQFVHHLQVKFQWEPECEPNTIKAVAFKENQE